MVEKHYSTFCRILRVYIFSLLLFFLQPAILIGTEIILPLRVGYVPLVSHLSLVESYERNQFSYKIVDVKLSRYNSYTGLEASLRVGAIDMAYIPVPIALSMISEGIDIKIVGALHKGGSGLIGYRKGNLLTLQGKRIGVPGLDSNENYILRRVLSEKGLRYGLDYRTIAISFQSVIKDFGNQRVDAIFFPEPYISIAQDNLDGIALPLDPFLFVEETFSVLVIRGRLLEKDFRNEVKEYLSSICSTINLFNSRSSLEKSDIIRNDTIDDKILQKIFSDESKRLTFNLFPLEFRLLDDFQNVSFELGMMSDKIDLEVAVDSELFLEVTKKGTCQ